MKTDKKVMIGIMVILVVTIVIMLVTATALVNKWFNYEYETVKYSSVLCNENKYAVGDLFNDENCFTDCALRCVSTGYKYKEHFQSDECSFGCGCECI